MPRPQTLTTVENVPLVAGNLSLDFVNTTGARASGVPRERLRQYRDLVTWSQRAGILDARAAGRLQHTAARRHAAAAHVLRRACTLREDLYGVFSASLAGRRPTPRVVARLAGHWRAARRHQELIAGENGFEIRFVAGGADVGSMISLIVMSAVDLLTSDRLSLVKRCAECDWLFLDVSKKGARKWCKSTCGNRARSRDRYERLRQVN